MKTTAFGAAVLQHTAVRKFSDLQTCLKPLGIAVLKVVKGHFGHVTVLCVAVLKQTAVKKYLGFPLSTPKAGSNPTLTAVQPLGHAAGGKPIQTFAHRPQQREKKKRR